MQTSKAPCFGQTAEEVEYWLRARVEVGASVAIRNTQAGLLHYVPAKVVRLAAGNLRLSQSKAMVWERAEILSTILARIVGAPKGRPGS